MKNKILLILSTFFFLVPTITNAQIDYVALGDSISTGYGLETTEKSFVQLFAEDNGYDSSEVLNAALNGATIKEVELLLKSDEELESLISDPTALAVAKEKAKEVQNAIKEAEVVTLTAGGNDLLNILYKEIVNYYANNDLPSTTVEEVKQKLSEGDILTIYYTSLVLSSEDLKTSITTEIANFKASLQGIVNDLKKLNSELKIIIPTQYNPYYIFKDVNTYGVVYTKFQESIEILNTAISSVATDPSIMIPSVEETINDSKYLNASMSPFNLDFHPNALGHEKIAEAIDNSWVRKSIVYIKPYADKEDKYECTATEDDNLIYCDSGWEFPKEGYHLIGYSATEGKDDIVYYLNTSNNMAQSEHTNTEGNWIGKNKMVIYGVWEKNPYIEICEFDLPRNCININTTNNDILGDGKVSYNETTKVLTIKDTTLEKEILIYEEGVEIVLDNAKITSTKEGYYGAIELNNNAIINIKNDSFVQTIYSFLGDEKSLIIRGDKSLTTEGILVGDLEIQKGVTINSEYAESNGLLKVAGTLNLKAGEYPESGIITGKLLVTSTGKVTIDGFDVGVFSPYDAKIKLDSNNSIVLEDGALFETKNTKVALLVESLFSGEPLEAGKVINLPVNYLDSSLELKRIQDDTDENRYYYTIAQVGVEPSLGEAAEFGIRVINNATGNIKFEKVSEKEEEKDETEKEDETVIPDNKEEEKDDKPNDELENPNTGDSLINNITLTILFTLGLIIGIKYIKKELN